MDASTLAAVADRTGLGADPLSWGPDAREDASPVVVEVAAIVAGAGGEVLVCTASPLRPMPYGNGSGTSGTWPTELV